MNLDHSDDQLDRLLHRPMAEVPDAGFSATVMARVRALPAPIEPVQALAQLQQRRTSTQRAARCNRYGIGVGVAAALATMLASGTPTTLAGHGVALTLALLISAAAVAWPLLSEPDWPA